MVLEPVEITKQEGIRADKVIFGVAENGGGFTSTGFKTASDSWRSDSFDEVNVLTDEAFDAWEESLKKRQ